MEIYSNFDDFFKFYIGEVEKQFPNYKTFVQLGQTAIIHRKLTRLTRQQINDTNDAIRIVCKFPKRIELVYAPNMFTFASAFDPKKKKVIIIYPTVAYYFRQFPDLLKVLIQHELGHILNKDIFEDNERKHARCTNICMDVRINMHLSYDHLDYANRCLFTFTNEKTDLLVPETFYPKLGLPLIAGGYDWRTSHDYYHLFDTEQKKQDKGEGEAGEGEGEGEEGGEGEMTQEMLDELADILEDLMGGGDNPDEGDMDDDVSESEAGEGEGEGEEKEGDGKEGGKGESKEKKLRKGDFVKVKSSGDYGVVEQINEDGTYKVREPNDKEHEKLDKILSEKNDKQFSAEKMQDGGEIGDFEKEDLEKISMSKSKDKGDEEKEKGEGEGEGDEGKEGGEQSEDKSSNNRDLKKISRQIDKVKRGVRKIDDKYKLTDEQKSGIEKSLGELDDLKSQIQSGEQGDAKEALDEFNRITKEINEQIKDVMRDISKKVDDFYKKNNKVNTRGIEPCGAVKRKPKYKEGDKRVIENAINSVIQEIKDNPMVFKDLTEISPDTFNVGTGVGSETGKIQLLEIGQPEWISQLESEMKDFRKRGKKKSYYDIESMVRNIPAKQKTKGVIKQKGVYILLDVSGSMWQGSYKGKNLMELLASYIPPIAKDFDGELWQIDAGRPTHVIPLKELRGSDFLNVSGGGGTNYDEALQLIKEKKEELKSEGKSDEFLTILFTDTEVYWNLDLLPNNLLIVTLANKESGLPELDITRNQKGLLIEVDEDYGD